MIPSGMIYSSSKACLNYISKYLAVNFASKNICVNSILPGGIEDSTCQTPFFQREYKKRVPMNKMALMENIGDALIFCLSENNTYFTGQELLIDGGWSLW
jgi:NAD(P)-dependent dehydrogenase (short-subunit alcohol dehydrogenase family)